MKIIKENLRNVPLTCCGRDITCQEKENFFAFLDMINGASIIYRGVSNNYLEKLYNTNTRNIPLLSSLIFLYGDKGKSFLYKYNIKEDINYSEDLCYRLILKTLKDTFEKEESNNNAVNRRLSEFKYKEQDVVSEIIATNADEWCSKIMALSEVNRIAVKDYYFSFLHKVNKAGYGNYSYFLSTSSRENIARHFCHEDGVILVGWTNGKNIKCKANNISELGFPIFKHDFFPEQKEETFKCGLLPHFIIGYHYEDKFEINPYIKDIKDFKLVRKDGIPVRQEKFTEMLSKTNFKSYYSTLDEFYWQEDVNT